MAGSTYWLRSVSVLPRPNVLGLAFIYEERGTPRNQRRSIRSQDPSLLLTASCTRKRRTICLLRNTACIMLDRVRRKGHFMRPRSSESLDDAEEQGENVLQFRTK